MGCGRCYTNDGVRERSDGKGAREGDDGKVEGDLTTHGGEGIVVLDV